MKLLVTKTLLVKALEYVSLSNYKAGDDEEDKAIMIFCDNYVLTLTGGNAENHVEITIEAEIEEPGEIVIQASDLDKQIKGFPSKEIMLTGNDEFMYFETSEDTEDSLKCNMKVDAVKSEKFKDYTPSKKMQILKINAGELSDAFAASIIGVDKKSPKEELRNVGMVTTKDTIDIVGFSSKRLSIFTVDTNGTNEIVDEKRFTIPYMAIKNIVKMFKKGKTEIIVTMERNAQGNFLCFKNEVSEIYTKILNTTYPDYKRILNNSYNMTMKFESANLKRAISSLTGISKVNVVVTLAPGEENVRFTMSGDGSKTGLAIPCEFTGNKKIIKIYGKDLKEAFSNVTGKECSLNIIQDALFVMKEAPGTYVFFGSLCRL